MQVPTRKKQRGRRARAAPPEPTRKKGKKKNRAPPKPKEGSLQFEDEIVAYMKEVTTTDEARKYLRQRGVRAKTAAEYLRCADRLDRAARRAGHAEGMRTADAFIVYIYARLRAGLATANSTLTYQRSALAFREHCEARPPWPDCDEVRALVACHNFAGKLQRAERARTLRGALTKDILDTLKLEKEMGLIVWVQYWACLRPSEVLGLKVNCIGEHGDIKIDSNKKYRRTNATTTATSQRKPLCAEAAELVQQVVRLARRGGLGEEDNMFRFSLAEYRKELSAVMKKSKPKLPSQLAFVPHSIRHGRVVDMRLSNGQQPQVLTDQQLLQAGMTRVTSMRYGRTNAERVFLASPDEHADDSSSSDESDEDVANAPAATASGEATEEEGDVAES